MKLRSGLRLETVYGMGYLALDADGPTVVEVPRDVLGVFNDMWMREVENLGPPAAIAAPAALIGACQQL